ncbi:apolipoprotein D-like [Pollicipes pollicipes]|uniref:apolipoprotein D-like n=1 Tax=Pollicipes pollicipes TaxID=41117 RepID=UPI0018852D1D|nr:apolipoprotein D-like [Pollicipes pollicipes]
MPRHPALQGPFLGDWYVVKNFDPDSSCMSFSYTECGAHCMLVQEQKQLNLISNIGLSNVYQTKGELKSPSGDAARMTANFADSPRVADYTVLTTDYESYAAVFTCETVRLARLPLFHRRDVYVMSRRRNATLSLAQLDKVSEALITNQIEDEFEPVSQNNCISSSEALLDLDTNRLVQGFNALTAPWQRVTDAASSFTSRISSFTSSIAGIFSGIGRRPSQ